MADQERSSESRLISEDRRTIGLEATWEIAALNETIRELCAGLGLDGDSDQEELMSLRLKMRGLTARIDELNNAVISVLDNDDDTNNLARRVLGNADARQFINAEIGA